MNTYEIKNIKPSVNGGGYIVALSCRCYATNPSGEKAETVVHSTFATPQGLLTAATTASLLALAETIVANAGAKAKLDIILTKRNSVFIFEPNSSKVITDIGGGGSVSSGGSGEGTQKSYPVGALNPAVGKVIAISALGAPILGLANSATTAELIGFVIANDGTVFTVATGGNISTLAGLVPGSVYYLSTTVAGGITTTPPSTPGHINRPVLLADSTTGGLVITSMRGYEVVAQNTDMPLGNKTQTLVEKTGGIAGGVQLRLKNVKYKSGNQPIFVHIEIMVDTPGIYVQSLNCYDAALGTHVSVSQEMGYSHSNSVVSKTDGSFQITQGSETLMPRLLNLSAIIPPNTEYMLQEFLFTGVQCAAPFIWSWKEYTQLTT